MHEEVMLGQGSRRPGLPVLALPVTHCGTLERKIFPGQGLSVPPFVQQVGWAGAESVAHHW